MNLFKTSSLAALTMAGAFTLAACGSSADSADSTPGTDGSTKLIVATTVSPLTSITSAVAGDLVTIEGIVPEGTNSHTFEPAPQVAELLSTADVIFVNGLKLEDPTIDLAEANLKPGAEIVEIGTLVLPESDYLYDFSFPEEEGKPNPHLWTDPSYAIAYADVIREVLSERLPEDAPAFQANFDAFATEVAKLDEAVRADQPSVPEGNLKLVTYHDAYAYFAQNYGWTVVGAIQPDSFDDPSPAEVARLVEQIKAEGVPVIFGSEVFPSAVLEAIGNEAGVRYEDSLRDDDLPGVPGEAQHSLLELLRYNYSTMITGLGGNATALNAIVFEVPADNAIYPQ
ncbi:MAG: metal ABC transporter substrate-binding protein [Candidatus Nanopelagicales bacterium]|nr:metal ABC transporter substrate-binding protein [Candidatus Nanopelagicales bacterium]MDP4824783.1 metal ABC transporter substrate-binding protein [Candidatus Nanopelagicales bacterium]